MTRSSTVWIFAMASLVFGGGTIVAQGTIETGRVGTSEDHIPQVRRLPLRSSWSRAGTDVNDVHLGAVFHGHANDPGLIRELRGRRSPLQRGSRVQVGQGPAQSGLRRVRGHVPDNGKGPPGPGQHFPVVPDDIVPRDGGDPRLGAVGSPLSVAFSTMSCCSAFSSISSLSNQEMRSVS